MHLVVTFPLVVAIVSAGLVRFNRSLEEAAVDLGASQMQMLRYVVLPQIGAVARGRGDLRLRVVVQQLRDLVLHRRLRADVPGLGLLDPAPVGEPAGRQRRLDGDRARAGARRVRRLAADEAADPRERRRRGAHRADGRERCADGSAPRFRPRRARPKRAAQPRVRPLAFMALPDRAADAALPRCRWRSMAVVAFERGIARAATRASASTTSARSSATRSTATSP